MQLTFKPVRLTGFAILAVAAATALSVGGCSSHKSSDTSSHKSPAKSAPASASGKDSVVGLVASVSGDTVEVTEAKGTAKVGVSSSTKVTEYTKAQLTDIAAGNCVSVVTTAAPAPGGAVTANAVQLVLQGADGKCPPQPKNPPPNNVVGTVASVEGNTINVTVSGANPSEIPVTVADITRYSKHASANSQAIAQGKCITARGTKDGGGTLNATVVALSPGNDGHCAGR
jgi:uncharacterized protein YceK